MVKIAINGFGRIGRNSFKIAFERRDIEIVAINDITDNQTLAHLLKYDSTYGTYNRKVTADDEMVAFVSNKQAGSTLPLQCVQQHLHLAEHRFCLLLLFCLVHNIN